MAVAALCLRKAGDRWRVRIPMARRAGVASGYLARIGLVAAGPLPGPVVDPWAGPLAILEILRASAAGPTPWPSTRA
jgi:hypothetical protein